MQIGDRVRIVDAKVGHIRSGHKHAGSMGVIAEVTPDEYLQDFPWRYEVSVEGWEAASGTVPFHPEELVLVNDGE